ncbi:MAG: hypothetical protein EXR58_05315 [Chloroflexi bacterium]|nr:hypothetical protein [Chloroflexota bacterium]
MTLGSFILRIGKSGRPEEEEVLKTIEPTTNIRAKRVAVRLTLSCGWCAREVDGVDGEREVTSGHVLLADAPDSYRLLGGRPVCIQCGGPLFIADWRQARRLSTMTRDLFADDDAESKSAAAA